MKTREILSDIVKINSYSSNELELSKYIRDFLSSKGANIIDVEGNILIHINNGSDKAILFNAHMDTVKIGDISKWESNPFILTERDGKYFGLGASDEKISIAILLSLFDEPSSIISESDIFFMFVRNEEVDGSGSKVLSEYFSRNYKYNKTACIMCEPTDAEYVELGNKGSIFFEITATGKSAHASKPEEGENAILKTINFINNLKIEFEKEIVVCPRLGPPTIACPTIIHGGETINVIPDKCVATGDIRTNTFCHTKMIDLLNKYKTEIKIVSETRPYLLDDNCEIVDLFKKLGIVKNRYTTGSNDCIFFGDLEIPSIVYGAGTKSCIHKPNEFIIVENIEKVKQTYLDLIKQF